MTETREKIIEQASELFWKNSYDSVGVDSICKAAGIQKGSFYHFFSSKEVLLFEILDQMEKRCYETVAEECFLPNISAKQKLKKFLNYVHDQMAEQKDMCGMICGCPVGNVGAEMAAKNEVIRLKIQELFNKNSESIKEILDQAKKEGFLDKSTNTKQLSLTFFACFQGAVLLAKTQNDPKAFKKAMETFLKTIFTK